MKIVLALDSFKGSLSAREVCDAVEEGGLIGPLGCRDRIDSNGRWRRRYRRCVDVCAWW